MMGRRLAHIIRWGVMILGLCLITACKIELNVGLQEQEANAMMAKLLSEGIQVSKVSDGDTVTLMVKTKQFGQAVDVLEAHGFPKRSFSSMSDVFADDGLVASPLQEWARFNYAKAQELSQSISSIPGVISADVHIASTRKQNPFDEASPPGASVLIQMREDMITPELVPQVKQLVTFSIPDIEYSRVGVIVSPIRRKSQGVNMVSVLGIIMPETSARQMQSRMAFMGGGGLFLFLAAVAGGFFAGRHFAMAKRA